MNCIYYRNLPFNYVLYTKPRSATCNDPGNVCCRNSRYFDLPLSSEDTADIRMEAFYSSHCGQHIDYDDVADLRADRRPADITTYSHKGEWPHMCTILKTKSSKENGKTGCSRTLEYVCGASLNKSFSSIRISTSVIKSLIS